MNALKLYRLVALPKKRTVPTKRPDRTSEELRPRSTRASQRLAHSEEHTHAAIRSQPPGTVTQSMRTPTALPNSNTPKSPQVPTKLKPADRTEMRPTDLLSRHHSASHRTCCQLRLLACSTRSTLSSRSFSADQSVTSRTVSGSTTSYPSMGFVPLQDTTAYSL